MNIEKEVKEYIEKYNRKPYVCKYCELVISQTNRIHHCTTERHKLHEKIYNLEKRIKELEK